ncbi:unnamed protein product [Lactuca saligna]|uniref:Uncharacterized protein n=1 Tax=Lactuca saligna TaxID=75948 RepID=A0AA35YRG0_LACSI|nr:unnamed protein product [Lactuca saligna]
MIIYSESTADEDETIPETPEANLHKDTSTPTQTVVIPPKDLVSKSLSEEARTSNILVNISNTDENAIMGEDDSKKENQGKPSTVTSETFVSLPPQITPVITTTSTTDSPTFENIIKQPITSLFSSQSTDPPTTTSQIQESIFMETEHEFEDIGGGHSVTSLEVDGLLKLLEGRITLKVSGMIKDSGSRLLEKVDICDHNNEMRVNSQKSTFEGDLKELRIVTKELLD